MQTSCEPITPLRPAPTGAFAPIDVRIDHGHALLAAGIRATLAALPQSDGVCPSDRFTRVRVTDLAQAMQLRAESKPRLERDPVLVVENSLTVHKVRALLHCDVQGCVSAEGGPGELLAAVRTLGAGGTYFCPLTSGLLADALVRTELSSREQRVLELLCDGLDNKSIAARMHIAPGTVKCHVKSILTKTATHTRTAVAAKAIREGWIQTPP